MAKDSELYSLYEQCELCPRACGVNRLQGQTGFCGQNGQIKLACACLHKGEEPPLCKNSGSGTLFFSGCTLKCVSCQNYQLSKDGIGREVTDSELADIMCRLQASGACNINLVTGSHFIPGIISAVCLARDRGMKLSVIWNTSGYESIAMLELLHRHVDIYLADVKTLDEVIARKLCAAPDYPQRAAAALRHMAAAKLLRWEKGRFIQGVIVRHLLLPEAITAAEQVLAWYKKKLEKKALLSLMTQFIPVTSYQKKAKAESHNACALMLDRRLTHSEYKKATNLLEKYNIEEGFLQEPAEDDIWLPDFTRLNPFPEDYAETIWHYSGGYINTDRLC